MCALRRCGRVGRRGDRGREGKGWQAAGGPERSCGSYVAWGALRLVLFTRFRGRGAGGVIIIFMAVSMFVLVGVGGFLLREPRGVS